MRCLLRKIEGLGGIPGPEAYQMKKLNTPNVDACAVEINSTSKSEVFPTWAPLPNPKEMKASLSKVQAFKFILQNAASKLRLFQTSIFKFYLLSPISALLLPTCSTSSFQKLVEKVRNYIKEVWLIFKKWVWRVDFERFFFEKKVFCLVKWAKTNAFSSIGKMKADKTAKSFPTYRILVFSKFDRLDPIYQISKKRE